MLMTIYDSLICRIVDWIVNKPSFTDWLMVIITGIYTFETNKIFKANLNSANASKAQLEESKRQYEETKRLQIMPYFRVDFEKWIPTRQENQIIPHYALKLSNTLQQEDEISGYCSDDYDFWDFLIYSCKNNINTEIKRSLRFEFDDFYGNHYYQDLFVAFFVEKNIIRINSYNMQVPIFIGKQEETQNV